MKDENTTEWVHPAIEMTDKIIADAEANGYDIVKQLGELREEVVRLAALDPRD